MSKSCRVSFLVKARDKEGNPVMMVINPDSVTSVHGNIGRPTEFPGAR
jgi:hypothetical protein